MGPETFEKLVVALSTVSVGPQKSPVRLQASYYMACLGSCMTDVYAIVFVSYGMISADHHAGWSNWLTPYPLRLFRYVPLCCVTCPYIPLLLRHIPSCSIMLRYLPLSTSSPFFRIHVWPWRPTRTQKNLPGHEKTQGFEPCRCQKICCYLFTTSFALGPELSAPGQQICRYLLLFLHLDSRFAAVYCSFCTCPADLLLFV